MARLIYNNEGGLLGANPGSGGTTITFAIAPNFATISGSDYIPLVLDAGLATMEIVYLTAYTAAATTGTITRAAEDSANWPAVAHPSGTWVCAPTIRDIQYPIGNPAGRAYATSGTAISGTNVMTLAATSFLQGGMTFTSGTGTGLVVPVAGYYQVNGMFKVTNGSSVAPAVVLFKNNATLLTYGGSAASNAAGYQAYLVSDIFLFAVNDVINLGYAIGTNTTLQCDGPGESNYLSAFLVSVAP